MKHKHVLGILIVNLILILAGGAFLYWYYDLDGYWWNPPITYENGVDPRDLKVTKEEYKPGEMVQAYTAFCKNRPYTAEAQYSLADGTIIFFSPKASNDVSPGCYPETGSTTVYDVERIPPDALPGCDHYMIGVITRTISGGRTRQETVKTEDFCIIPRG